MAEQWRALGLQVFFDEDSILPGEVVIRGIERGITGSDHVVLVLSRASLASPWVVMELAMARTSDPSGDHRKLIPVRIEPMELESIPLAIRSLSIVDLAPPEHRTQRYHQLLRSLGVVAPHLPEVPAFDDHLEPVAGPGAGRQGAGEGATTRRVGFELIIDGNPEDLTPRQESALMAAIKALAGAGGELTIRRIRRGSILLTPELSLEESRRLQEAVARRELSGFDVRDARIVADDPSITLPGTTHVPPGTGGPERRASERLLREHRDWIERVVAVICSKHGLWGADARDFAGWLQSRLAEDDYGVLQNLPGDVDARSYLALVVRRQFQEYRRRRWGGWRTSLEAQRLGPPAPELEVLVHRDGYRLDQAGQILRTEGRTTLSDTALARLLDQLPRRPPLRTPDAAEAQVWRDRATIALDRALSRLDPEDRLIVRMHLQEGRTLDYVARALKLKKKRLRERVEQLRARLQAFLEQEGVPPGEIKGLGPTDSADGSMHRRKP